MYIVLLAECFDLSATMVINCCFIIPPPVIVVRLCFLVPCTGCVGALSGSQFHKTGVAIGFSKYEWNLLCQTWLARLNSFCLLTISYS